MEMMIHSINEEDLQRTICLMTNKNLLSETLMWMLEYFPQEKKINQFSIFVNWEIFLSSSLLN